MVAKALDKYMYSDIPQEIILSGECWNVKTLAIDGNTLIKLGYAGKSIGQELEELVSHVIESPEDNTEERLINLAKEKLKK